MLLLPLFLHELFPVWTTICAEENVDFFIGYEAEKNFALVDVSVNSKLNATKVLCQLERLQD